MKRILIGLAVASLALAALVPSVAARTTRIEFDGTMELDHVVAEGTYSMAGTVLSARDMVWVYMNAGSPYIAGPDTVVINYDLDVSTGAGELWGTDRLEPVAFAGGAFDCTWHGTFRDFVWTGKVVCHGEGSLDGWQLRGRLLPEPGGDAGAYPGYVFMPGE